MGRHQIQWIKIIYLRNNLATMPRIPKLIVFDLDYTLWPFWVDTHVTPPFSRDRDGTISDFCRRPVTCYPDVPKMLKDLHSQGIKLGIASRTTCLEEAKSLVSLFQWDRYFDFRFIYPAQKTVHFYKFLHDSGIPFSDMLFFDDEERNVKDVSQLGVVSILAEHGMTQEVLAKGLAQFAHRALEN